MPVLLCLNKRTNIIKAWTPIIGRLVKFPAELHFNAFIISFVVNRNRLNYLRKSVFCTNMNIQCHKIRKNNIHMLCVFLHYINTRKSSEMIKAEWMRHFLMIIKHALLHYNFILYRNCIETHLRSRMKPKQFYQISSSSLHLVYIIKLRF